MSGRRKPLLHPHLCNDMATTLGHALAAINEDSERVARIARRDEDQQLAMFGFANIKPSMDAAIDRGPREALMIAMGLLSDIQEEAPPPSPEKLRQSLNRVKYILDGVRCALPR